MALRQVGRVNVAQIVAGGQRVTRTAALVSKSNEEYFLVTIQRAGHSGVQQDGRRAHLKQGDLALFLSAQQFELSFDGDFAQTVVTVPANELRQLVPSVDRLTATTLDGQTAAASLFKQFAQHYFEADCSALSPLSVNHAGSALLEILAGTLADYRSHQEAKQSNLARFHLARVKQYAIQNMRHAELSVATVSSAVRISPVHIHRLFAGETQTFSAWLWSCRLIACKHMLEDPACSHLSITELAFRNGFSNSAHFSHAFRAKFGVTPRESRVGSSGD